MGDVCNKQFLGEDKKVYIIIYLYVNNQFSRIEYLIIILKQVG